MYIKFLSHRQRDRAKSQIGKRQEYFSFYRDTGYGVIDVTPGDVEKLWAEGVKFTKLRGPYSDIHKCIDWK